MSRRHRSTIRPKAEMNLTSMMDLTFLLLITFIITFPLIEQGFDVSLPKGKAPPLEADQKPAVVTIDKEGRIFLGQDLISTEALAGQLNIARSANELGIKKLALATQEP